MGTNSGVRDDVPMLFSFDSEPSSATTTTAASQSTQPMPVGQSPPAPLVALAPSHSGAGSGSQSGSLSNAVSASSQQAGTQQPLLPLVEPRAQRLDASLSAIPHPFPIPPDDTSAYPGHKKIRGICPVPGCSWNKKHNIQVHIHACWRRYLYTKVFKAFGQTHRLPGGACPWYQCQAKCSDPAQLAKHLSSHYQLGGRCMVRREDGVVCGEKNYEGTYADHLEVVHGLLATEKDPTGSVKYCGTCHEFVQGKANFERHLRAHLGPYEEQFALDSLCFAQGSDFNNADICIFHFADESAPISSRLNSYRAGMGHVITHFLNMDGSQVHACVFPRCPVKRMKPVRLIDHYIEAHGLCLTPYYRHPIHGDLSKLAMNSYDENKLKEGAFPICNS